MYRPILFAVPGRPGTAKGRLKDGKKTSRDGKKVVFLSSRDGAGRKRRLGTEFGTEKIKANFRPARTPPRRPGTSFPVLSVPAPTFFRDGKSSRDVPGHEKNLKCHPGEAPRDVSGRPRTAFIRPGTSSWAEKTSFSSPETEVSSGETDEDGNNDRRF